MPWLQGRSSGTAYSDDPLSKATFGVYKGGPVIYIREMY
jgi:MSHA biogenesis protein MshQ